MRILVLSLLVVFSFANDNTTMKLNTSVVDSNATTKNDNNATISNNNNISSNQAKTEANDPTINADEKLKNDIIAFNRVDYIKENSKIDDPFIYVYPQSEADLEAFNKANQAVLVLNGVFEEEKASINNTWLGKGETIEGWTVSNIQQNKVELKFRTQTKILSVYKDHNIKIYEIK